MVTTCSAHGSEQSSGMTNTQMETTQDMIQHKIVRINTNTYLLHCHKVALIVEQVDVDKMHNAV